jgi:hypothetical protein
MIDLFSLLQQTVYSQHYFLKLCKIISPFILLHRPHTVKKGWRHSRPQPGCHTKLSLGGYNLIIFAQGEFGQ